MNSRLFIKSITHVEAIDMYCDFIEQLFDKLGFQTVPIIVGHSFGGYLMTQCISRLV